MSVFIGDKTKRVELAERKDATNPNLFTGSKDFTGNWLNVNNVKQKDKYLDFTAFYVDWQWNGISQYIDVKKDEVLTFSVYFKAKAGSSVYWYTMLNTDNEDGYTKANTSSESQSPTATGDWQRFSATFTVTSDGTIKPRLEGDGTESFWFAGMKIEKGAVATPWCPALEDFAWTSDITNLQTAIASAGKVKTVNGTQPDNTGNISIAIPDISGKADKTDVTNLQSMITGLSTKVDSLQQNSLKIVPIIQAAQTHNATYRGQDLGSFNETFASDIENGTFNNMWVGDYFTVNKHKYKIAGFNYKYGHQENTNLANHLIMITDVLSSQAMNSTKTTAGGFAKTDLFVNYFPQIESQLQTDFGNHLLTFQSYLSTSIDDNGAPNNGQWFSLKAAMCNSAMWWGSPSQYSNNANGTKYNIGDETEQLPIMKLHPDEQTCDGRYVWLRDIFSGSAFAAADSDGSTDWNYADTSSGVRAFFLIG